MEKEVSILVLGDSYTSGEGEVVGRLVIAPEERYWCRLTQTLRGGGYNVAEPVVVARTGWTVDELMVEIDRAELQGTFGLVVVQAGVNNQYRAFAHTPPKPEYESRFMVDYCALIVKAVTFAGGDPGRAVALSIPDWGATPFAGARSAAVGRSIDRFNRTIQLVTAVEGVRYVDITRISRDGLCDPRLIAEDGLHPSGAMHARWVRAILPKAWAALDT